jgi:hypothetical protein
MAQNKPKPRGEFWLFLGFFAGVVEKFFESFFSVRVKT